MKQLFLVLIYFSLFLFISCTSVFYHPTKETYYTPEQMGFKKEEIIFNTEDGLKLYSWFIHSYKKEAKANILQLHGNGQNMTAHFLSLVIIYILTIIEVIGNRKVSQVQKIFTMIRLVISIESIRNVSKERKN